MITDNSSSPVSPYQVIIQPSQGWLDLQLRTLWQYRELLFFLVWRDIKIRYKQTALGVSWIVLQPLASMLVFNGLFGVLLQVPSDGAPYPVFVLAGLLPWQYFSGALTRSSTSLVDSTHLVTKVYFPRLVIPLAAVLSGLVDFAISLVILLVVMLIYHIPLSAAMLALPFLLILAMATALGFGLWLTALNVRYRDVKHLMPFIVQIWMYLTPVIYSATLIPERFRWLLAINPMTGVVQGFRQILLGGQMVKDQPSAMMFVVSIGITMLVLVLGAVYFRRTERTFADII